MKYCETCEKEGHKSKAFPSLNYTTCMGYMPFLDDQNQWHLHDGNSQTTTWECSRGHIWEEKNKGSCWCGWPDKEVEHRKDRSIPMPPKVKKILERVLKSADNDLQEEIKDVLGLMPLQPWTCSQELGMGIFNTRCFKDHPDNLHREFMKEPSYAKKYEAKRLIQIIKSSSKNILDTDPAWEVIKNLEEIYDVELDDKEEQIIDYQLQMERERRMELNYKASRLRDLEHMLHEHEKMIDSYGTFCPMTEALKAEGKK